ncbi:D-alanyl-D-alanine dipeptidase [Brevibacillus choshinensis]|uniref:D-alanyl-D-alanine dipeptidase n=1 Tax=Brevibacillus choshinensis TaxID=54911 RepID=A0ABR5N2D6_BRECH|nr:M15 family metallopeptidase [Brevibacillus choshinensis]KQL44654.1 D-alanyl-D-alanine dipeptidase [Brevibacillus choshinensis]
MNYPPIPVKHDDRTAFTPPVIECGEAMVALSTLSPRISVYPAYYHLGYAGTQTEAFLRKGVAHRLASAAEQLPAGYQLVVLDGWRSYEVQASLYEGFRQSLIAQGLTDEEAIIHELSKFVAKPTMDIEKPSPHLSGGAVDLTIAGPDGWLEMGTDFDDFTELAMTRHFEELPEPTEKELVIRNNRRLLYHIMVDAGFTNYSNEWWHYEYGTRSWARQTDQQPIYGGILEIHEKCVE